MPSVGAEEEWILGSFDEVKRQVVLSEVVKEHSDLTKVGDGQWRGACPVHGGDNPTGFSVNDTSGLWHCYSGSCGGGSVVDFIVSMGMASDIYSAVDYLGERYSLNLPTKQRSVDDKARLAALELVVREAERQLVSAPGVVMDYVEERGIRPEVRDVWRIGFIHDPSAVVAKLRKSGLLAAAEDVGLVNRSFGSMTVRPGNRLLMPVIRDGKPVAWSARVVDSVTPSSQASAKYINSRDSSIYHKNSTLYGEHVIDHDTDMVIVVEGNVDAALLNEAFYDEGFDGVSVVASCGTAFTDGQYRRILELGRNVDRLNVLFDGDEGGKKAYRRLSWLMAQDDVDVGVPVDVPDGSDPADVVCDLWGTDELVDYLDVVSGDGVSLPAFVGGLIAEDGMEGAVEWIRGSMEELSTGQRREVCAEVARCIGVSASKVEDEVGPYVPKRVLRNTGGSGFVVPVVREMLALSPEVRRVVAGVVAGDSPVIRDSLKLSRKDKSFVASVVDVEIRGDATSDAEIAEFVAQYGAMGDGGYIVPSAVCRALLSEDISREDKLVAAAVAARPHVPEGDEVWLWIAGVVGGLSYDQDE